MNEKRIFTESPDRTHVLITEIKTKAGKWMQVNKSYSQSGFGEKDYILEYSFQAMRQKENGINLENTDIRVLNAMRKQVFSSAAYKIGHIFGTWGAGDNFSKVPYLENPILYSYKIASIRYKDSELNDEFITNINEENGWKSFTKILQDISFKNNGFKSVQIMEQVPEDDYLNWFKIKCYSDLEFTVALYK